MSTETQSIASAHESTDAQRRELWREYERRKSQWVRDNPDASACEYGEAVMRITEELGV